eukprot:gene42005-49853_t
MVYDVWHVGGKRAPWNDTLHHDYEQVSRHDAALVGCAYRGPGCTPMGYLL